MMPSPHRVHSAIKEKGKQEKAKVYCKPKQEFIAVGTKRALTHQQSQQ